MAKKMIVAIDGPAGSGKSTLAKNIARRLSFLYVDTGAMYRAVTYNAIKNGIIGDESAIISQVKNSDIRLSFENGLTRVFINGEEVTAYIRSAEVNSYVSPVAKIAEVRYELVEKQRRLAEHGNLVAEGRDTTTVVYPEADVKIYLIANIEERAKRRLKEFREGGTEITLDEVKKNLAERDKIDSGRAIGPLTKADDAIEVDTSNMTIEEETEKIVAIINTKQNKIF